MSTDLLVRMNSSVSKAQDAAQVTYEVLTGKLDESINVNGAEAPTLATRVRDYIASLGSDTLDGIDGASIEFIEIRDDRHLWAKIENQPEKDLGEVIPEAPTGVEYVNYDDLSGELEIGLTDGTIIGPFVVKGDSASNIEEAYL